MARITYGPLITDLKGSIGGLTFQNNPSGSIVRMRPKSRRAGSQLQTSRLVITRFLVQKWGLLSLENQELWNAYAEDHLFIRKSGESVRVTGFNWFVAANWQQTFDGQPVIEAPNSYVLPSVPSSFTFEVAGEDSVITLDTPDHDFSTVFLVYANMISKQSNVNTLKGFRFLDYWAGITKTSFSINTAYNSVFGINLGTTTFDSPVKIAIYLHPYQFESQVTSGKVQQIFEIS